MSKYKINTDPKLPTPAETQRFQNFDNLLKDVETIHRPWYLLHNLFKNFRLLKLVILFITIIMLLFFTSKYYQDDKKAHEKKQQEEQSENLKTDPHSLFLT